MKSVERWIHARVGIQGVLTQADRQPDRQAGRQTDREVGREIR